MVVDVVDHPRDAIIGVRVHASLLLIGWNLAEFPERGSQAFDKTIGSGFDNGCVQLGFIGVADVAFLEKLGARRLDKAFGHPLFSSRHRMLQSRPMVSNSRSE